MPNLTAEPTPQEDVQTASAALQGSQALADSVRAYALTHKPIGYKEYEAKARGMEGLNAWWVVDGGRECLVAWKMVGLNAWWHGSWRA